MIPILIEEPHFLVADKPAGLLTQAAPGIPSLQTKLSDQIKQRDAHSGKPFIGLPHRLDRGTTGAVLIARNQRSLKRFGQQFQSRKVGKFYLVAACGQPVSQLDSHWRDFIRKIPDLPVAEIVPEGTEGARLAQLDVKVLASDAQQHVLLVHLHTGRMHQIRVQASVRGLTILGDSTYGATEFPENGWPQPNTSNELESRQQPLALHAVRLQFRHPQTGVGVAVTAPLPEVWQTLPQSLTARAEHVVECSQSDCPASWNLRWQQDGVSGFQHGHH